jgi:DnaJ domain/DnaJ C terminal domain
VRRRFGPLVPIHVRDVCPRMTFASCGSPPPAVDPASREAGPPPELPAPSPAGLPVDAVEPAADEEVVRDVPVLVGNGVCTVDVGNEGTVVVVGSGGGGRGTDGSVDVTERIDVTEVIEGTGGGGRPSASAWPVRRPATSRAAKAAACRIPRQLRSAQSGCGVWGMSNNPRVATVKRDYYDVLGLSPDADEETIRRAFHSLARDCHPDVADGPDSEVRFRELAEAYGVLSKRDARLLYDRYGYRGAGNQGFDEARWEERTPTTRGENIHLSLELQSFEAAEGSRRVVSYEAAVRCQECAGRGSLRLANPDCELCGGTGRRRQALQLYFSDLLQIEECPECLARACASCGGSGTVVGQRRIRLGVPPGLQDCAQLRVGGEGNDAGAGSIPGDLLVQVRVLEPPRDPRIVRYAALVLLVIAASTLVLYVLR